MQAARQWWKRFKNVLQKFDFEPSLADPCFFIKKDGDLAMNSIYVDDGCIVGDPATINKIIQELGTCFTVKRLGPLKNYVGCHFDESKNGTIIVTQPKLFASLKKKFGKLVDNAEYATPAAPRFTIVRHEKDVIKISDSKQKDYRSGVGMLLYLVKYSRPDLANITRELSKVMDGATKAHWKALIRAISYALSTEEKGLILKPKRLEESLVLRGVSDSEYGGDRETRHSVFGYIVYFCGAPIAWKSKAMRSVTLLSTEAEYVAISEITKEIIFAKQVIETANIDIKLPIEIQVDNVGAIYLTQNYTTGQNTKHVDICYHFVRELIEDKVLQVNFIRSEENESDIMTKNTTRELFEKHQNKLIGNN